MAGLVAKERIVIPLVIADAVLIAHEGVEFSIRVGLTCIATDVKAVSLLVVVQGGIPDGERTVSCGVPFFFNGLLITTLSRTSRFRTFQSQLQILKYFIPMSSIFLS